MPLIQTKMRTKHSISVVKSIFSFVYGRQSNLFSSFMSLYARYGKIKLRNIISNVISTLQKKLIQWNCIEIGAANEKQKIIEK